eukprot:gene12372-12507_t
MQQAAMLVPWAAYTGQPAPRGNSSLELLKAQLQAVVQQLDLAPSICRKPETSMQGVRGVADWSSLKRSRPGASKQHNSYTIQQQHRPQDQAGSGDLRLMISISGVGKVGGGAGGRTYTSRFRGVHQTFPTRRWEAQFRRNGKPTSLGCFDK